MRVHWTAALDGARDIHVALKCLLMRILGHEAVLRAAAEDLGNKAAMLALTGCSSSGSAGAPSATDSHLQQVIKKVTLKVGVLPDYPPYSSHNASGKIVGYEPDIARRQAR